MPETPDLRRNPGGGSNHRHFQRRGIVQRGKDSGQPPGQHRLPAPRRSAQQKVVPARRGDLDGSDRDGLADHAGETVVPDERRGRATAFRIGGRWRQPVIGEEPHDVDQVTGAEDRNRGHE